jgi:hypothetical protein
MQALLHLSLIKICLFFKKIIKDKNMLITCKECGNKVSDKADKCPSCGIKITKSRSFIKSLIDSFIRIVFFIFLGFVGLLYFFADSDKKSKYDKEPIATRIVDSEPEFATTQKEPVKPSCATDWKLCKTTDDLINKNNVLSIQIQVACKMEAEKQHNQSIDWGGFLSPNFSSYIPEDLSGDRKEITVIDDVAMYENIYGAKVKTKTLCVYNLNDMKVATTIATQM